MAFLGLGKKKAKNEPENTSQEQAQAQAQGGKDAKAEAAAEKQRLKKIKAMKGKFDETVWQSSLDVMRTGIPQFVLQDKDPETGDTKLKYVVLGFDTKIVDDFSNKSDDDIGSIMTAIKASMDCVIEEALLENELILMIPTQKTLNSLKEFDDVFPMRFYIVYVTEDHEINVETKSEASQEFLEIGLQEVIDMIDANIYIQDKIDELKGRSDGAGYAGDPDDISAPVREEAGDEADNSGADGDNSGDSDDGDAVSEDDLPPEEGDKKPEAENGGDSDNDSGDGNDGGKDAEAVAKAAKEATEKAAAVASRIANQKADMPEGDSGAQLAAESSKADPEKPAAEPEAASAAAAAAAEKLDKLKGAVQKASDDALNDQAVKSAAANINPQARTFDMAAMDQYITRKYYSDDLKLEITSEPFDAMFMQSNTYVPFVEVADDSWLSGYVNSLRRDANARLAKLHNENLMLMRERYMLIIAKHCESITKSVSTDDPKSRFGYTLRTIQQIRDDNLAHLGEQAEGYKRECEQAYQAQLDAVMKNAANTAKAQFENTHKANHERELKEIETELRNNIESEYILAVENLKDERRNEAKRQLDAGVTEALKLCADEYTKMIAMERQEYARLQAVISDFQSDNMAAEESRVRTMAEDQRRENEVVRARREYDAKYETATREFEAKLAAVKAEIERANIEHSNHVQEIREQHEKMMQGLRDAQAEQLSHKDKEIETLTGQLDVANKQIESLTIKYAELDEKTGKKYATQIDMLRSEREAWTERAEQVEHLHKYTDRIKFTTMIIGVIAALALGIIIGCGIVANSANNKASEPPVINYYTDKSDKGDNAGDNSDQDGSEGEEADGRGDNSGEEVG